MKNIYYIFLLAFAALLAGCERHSVDPGTEVYPGAYIFLDAKVVNTKGENLYDETALPNKSHTSFGVLGLRADGVTPVFNEYSAYELQVSDDGQSTTITGGDSPFDNVAIMYRPRARNAFVYDIPALWAGGLHYFYAYYIHGCEYDDKDEVGFNNNTKNVISDFAVRTTSKKAYLTYHQPQTLDKMVDVMTAKTEIEKTDLVPLNFEHRLFAIDVVVSNSQFKDTGLGLTAAPFNGTDASVEFTVSTGASLYFDEDNTLSLNDETLPVSHEFGDFAIEAPSGTKSRVYNLNEKNVESENSFLFLPCESLHVKFTVNFLNSWDEEATYTYDGEITVKGGFKAGHKYQFILDRKHNSGDMIEFVPQVVETWDEKEVDHTFN